MSAHTTKLAISNSGKIWCCRTSVGMHRTDSDDADLNGGRTREFMREEKSNKRQAAVTVPWLK